VVFLLHGLPAGPAAYRNPRVGDLGRIAERDGTPAIVVAAQGARAGDSDPEWHDWGPGRDWETATSAELVRTIDARYRTIADPRSRALIGISAGGYGAALIGLHHPETYAVIQSWSGYFHPTTPDGHAPLDVGTDRDNLLAGAHSYVGCLARLAPADRPRLFGFYVGDRDSRFLPENRQLDAELRRAGVPHLFRVYRGSHSNAVWDAHEEAWLRAALARLDTTPPADGLDPQQRRQAAQRAGCPLA
jgi:enterochelin esterase-like enzyme